MPDNRGVSEIRFDERGLVPVVVQQWDTGEVLMMAWMDESALRETIATGSATYFSRSRQSRWVKGETSGHVQSVRDIRSASESNATKICGGGADDGDG